MLESHTHELILHIQTSELFVLAFFASAFYPRVLDEPLVKFLLLFKPMLQACSKIPSITSLIGNPRWLPVSAVLTYDTDQRRHSLSQHFVMALPADLSCGILLSE